MQELPNESALIADLKATFPGLPVRPISEYGLPEFTHGVWTGSGTNANFTDGLPLFIDWQDWFYDGGVHEGFTAWLESRGWYIENHDGETMFIIPIASARALATTDADLEAHISNLGEQMQAAYARWESDGCFSDRGAAVGLRMRMEAAIASRSPERAEAQVSP